MCHTDDSDVLLVEGQGQYAPPSAKVAGEIADDRPRDHVRCSAYSHLTIGFLRC